MGAIPSQDGADMLIGGDSAKIKFPHYLRLYFVVQRQRFYAKSNFTKYKNYSVGLKNGN